MKNKKFGARDQFGYALGDMGGSFVNLYVDAFFLTFATYVLGVSPFFMGTLFLVARIWDAITDVIMGSIPDRWKVGKSGDKFKPYIKIAIIPLALSGIFAFLDVSSFSTGMIHVWVSVVYIFYGMAYTGASIPYGSMLAVITKDPVERTKLSRARTVGALLPAILAMGVVPLVIFDNAGNIIPQAFLYIAIVFSILSIISYIGMLSLSTERIRDAEGEKPEYEFKQALVAVAKNRPLIGIMVATVGILLQGMAMGQIGTHLFKEYYGVPQALSLMLVGSIVIILIIFPFAPKLVARFGKRNIIMYSTIFSLMIFIFLFFVPIANVYLFITLFIIASVNTGLFQVVVWAVVTDTLDYNEYKTGKRYDGTMYSIYTFSRKVGSALSSSIASYGLGIMGFVSGAASQTPEVAENIRTLFTGMPVIGSLIALIGIAFIYNLTGPKTEEMYAELERRRLANK